MSLSSLLENKLVLKELAKVILRIQSASLLASKPSNGWTKKLDTNMKSSRAPHLQKKKNPRLVLGFAFVLQGKEMRGWVAVEVVVK